MTRLIFLDKRIGSCDKRFSRWKQALEWLLDIMDPRRSTPQTRLSVMLLSVFRKVQLGKEKTSERQCLISSIGLKTKEILVRKEVVAAFSWLSTIIMKTKLINSKTKIRELWCLRLKLKRININNRLLSNNSHQGPIKSHFNHKLTRSLILRTFPEGPLMCLHEATILQQQETPSQCTRHTTNALVTLFQAISMAIHQEDKYLLMQWGNLFQRLNLLAVALITKASKGQLRQPRITP